MKYFRVRNLDRFQHYKNRCPPWIKLHASIFENYNFSRLQDASKAHLMMIWLLASRTENHLPYDAEWIGKRINARSRVDLKTLQELDFIEMVQDASEVLAIRQQNADSETEGEIERKKESPLPPWLDQQAWSEFEQHRKEMRAPLSDLARTKAINALKKLVDQGESQSEVIDQTITNRWKGLFATKGKGKPNGQQTKPQAHQRASMPELPPKLPMPDRLKNVIADSLKEMP